MTTLHHTLPSMRARHAEQETVLIRAALVAHQWSLTRTAEALDIPIGTLRALIEKHGLQDIYEANAAPRGRPKTPRT